MYIKLCLKCCKACRLHVIYGLLRLSVSMLCGNFRSCGVSPSIVPTEKTFVKHIMVTVFMSEATAFLATLKYFLCLLFVV